MWPTTFGCYTSSCVTWTDQLEQSERASACPKSRQHDWTTVPDDDGHLFPQHEHHQPYTGVGQQEAESIQTGRVQSGLDLYPFFGNFCGEDEVCGCGFWGREFLRKDGMSVGFECRRVFWLMQWKCDSCIIQCLIWENQSGSSKSVAGEVVSFDNT
jgi:hypothetical protein